MHKDCLCGNLSPNKMLICNICNNFLEPFENQILCPNYDCPAIIILPSKAKTFNCKTCSTDFCKICKINLSDHQESCAESSLIRRRLKCGKCGKFAIRERGSFYYKCENCGYLCIVCTKGIYESHQECCISFAG